MRKFSSYGPINTKLHYYAPRTELLDHACLQLLGEDLNDGGHYITVWAPRQTGKTWLMQQVIARVKARGDFEFAILTMQLAKEIKDAQRVLRIFVKALSDWFRRDFPAIEEWEALPSLFTSDYFSKPLILIIDEFDALDDTIINQFANAFRGIYTERTNQADTPSAEKSNLLHGLALIGVRSVLGIENVSGSPFNVQRSVHIPNLTKDEVQGIFHWYEKESGQQIASTIMDRIYDEMQGQPGLTCWMGELLTEEYNRHQPEITMRDFDFAYSAAMDALPNNNILNIISKAKEKKYKPLVLEMYKTGAKLPFRYDDPTTNFLYMNGVVDHEVVFEGNGEYRHYLKFPSPFVQKRLFNYFAHELFMGLDRLYDPFADLSDTITDTSLHVPNLMRHYEAYVRENREWLFKDAPLRKTDERIYEAVYHFNLYMYLTQFLISYDASVIPEFPTGNGKIDLIIRHSGTRYALEVKSFINRREYRKALQQAAAYGAQLQESEIWLIFFVDSVSEENRRELEVSHHEDKSGITVYPIFVSTG
ncbi:AAA-like domain-containing protein [Chloroflexi bacterium TSY]|nr:AAA-like domain-containing protein [Chloroflexi bacterium TSY]